MGYLTALKVDFQWNDCVYTLLGPSSYKVSNVSHALAFLGVYRTNWIVGYWYHFLQNLDLSIHCSASSSISPSAFSLSILGLKVADWRNERGWRNIFAWPS